MAGKRQNSPNHSHALTVASDFCDFQSLETQERSSDDELDSDVEDAIYAKMYFTTSHIPHAPLPNQEGTELRSEAQNSQGRGVVLSLDPSSSSSSFSPSSQSGAHLTDKTQSKKNKKAKEKKPSVTRKRKEKKMCNPSADSGVGTMDSTDASMGDSGVITIDRGGGDGDPSAGEGTASPGSKKESPSSSSSLSTSRDVALDKTSGVGVAGRRKIQLKAKEKGSMSPESDIKRLFATPKKHVGPDVMVIDLTMEDSDFVDLTSENEDDADAVRSSSTSRCSMESGELEGSGTKSVRSTSSGGGGAEDDLWKINEKDKIGRDTYERLHGDEDSYGRYYGKRNTKCTNCKQKGHQAQTCPWPKRHTICYLCAGFKHISHKCPKNLCTYCYRSKHKGQSCRAPWAGLNTVCNRCYMKGHHASICPDIWRQFHHTTYESNQLVTISGDLQRRTHKIYCSNCSERGHFAFECTRTCPRYNPAHHLPLIALYNTDYWPPKDSRSLSIIAISRAKRNSEKSSTLDASEGREEGKRGERKEGKGKRELSFSGGEEEEEEEEEEECDDKLNSLPRPPKKKRKKNKKEKWKNSLPDDDCSITVEGEGTSLLVTVDGRRSSEGGGSDRNRRSSLLSNQDFNRSRPQALLATPSPAYTSSGMNKSRQLHSSPATPSSSGNFPRQSFTHTPYPHGNHRLDRDHEEDRHYRSDRDRNVSFTPPIITSDARQQQHTRTLSVDFDRRRPGPGSASLPLLLPPQPLMNRRYSDFDDRSLQDRARAWSSRGDRVTSQHNRDYLEMDRGDRISQQTARQIGYHDNEPWTSPTGHSNSYDSSSSSGSRRRSHDHHRF